MKLELFHYIHCPYCVRVRLALGFLQLPWHSHVLRYDDERTPVELTGKKMLPIMTIDGAPMNESLDIIRRLDQGDALKNDSWQDMDLVINELGALVHNLAMPYWVWTPEFTPEARAYFVKKKSLKRGPFPELAQKRAQFEGPLLQLLQKHQASLTPFWQSSSLSIRDIGLAAQLWGLYVVPEFRFSQPWHDYLMRVKQACRFDYFQQHWGTT